MRCHTFRAIITAPFWCANARLRVQIEITVAGTIGQTLQRVLIHLAAVLSLPALLAQTGAVRAESMAGARRMVQ